MKLVIGPSKRKTPFLENEPDPSWEGLEFVFRQGEDRNRNKGKLVMNHCFHVKEAPSLLPLGTTCFTSFTFCASRLVVATYKRAARVLTAEPQHHAESLFEEHLHIYVYDQNRLSRRSFMYVIMNFNACTRVAACFKSQRCSTFFSCVCRGEAMIELSELIPSGKKEYTIMLGPEHGTKKPKHESYGMFTCFLCPYCHYMPAQPIGTWVGINYTGPSLCMVGRHDKLDFDWCRSWCDGQKHETIWPKHQPRIRSLEKN